MYGLINFSNNCYHNSILQILFNTPIFVSTLKQYRAMSQLPKASVDIIPLMLAYLKEDKDELMYEHKKYIKDFHVFQTRFDIGQQDQHEYLSTLFHIIHESLYVPCTIEGLPTGTSVREKLDYKSLICLQKTSMTIDNDNLKDKVGENGEIVPNMKAYDSPIVNLFIGQFHGRVLCGGCNHISHSFESFCTLELPIDDTTDTLEDCIKMFTKIELLDEPITCDKCKKREKSHKRLNIWRLPKILVINLKRTIYTESGGCIKQTKVINIPDTLDLDPYISKSKDNSKYTLYAMGNHIGVPNGGHCYSSIKINDKWILCNDERLIEMEKRLPSSADNYLLFYKINEEEPDQQSDNL